MAGSSGLKWLWRKHSLSMSHLELCRSAQQFCLQAIIEQFGVRPYIPRQSSPSVIHGVWHRNRCCELEVRATDFIGPGIWGIFAPEQQTIYLALDIVQQLNPEQYRELLLHEAAHFWCYLCYGTTIRDHGPEFHAALKRLLSSQPELAQTATATVNSIDSLPIIELRNFIFDPDLDLDLPSLPGRLHREPVKEHQKLQKLKKLLALSRSPEPQEAALALLKARQLAQELYENVATTLEDVEADLNNPGMAPICLRVFKIKRTTPVLSALYGILVLLGHSPIWIRKDGHTYLDLFATAKEEEELKAYVMQLWEQLKRWSQQDRREQKEQHFFCIKSYFFGLKEAFGEVLRAHQGQQERQVVSRQDWTELKQWLFPRLSHSNRSQDIHLDSYERGKARGSTLPAGERLMLSF